MVLHPSCRDLNIIPTVTLECIGHFSAGKSDACTLPSHVPVGKFLGNTIIEVVDRMDSSSAVLESGVPRHKCVGFQHAPLRSPVLWAQART